VSGKTIPLARLELDGTPLGDVVWVKQKIMPSPNKVIVRNYVSLSHFESAVDQDDEVMLFVPQYGVEVKGTARHGYAVGSFGNDMLVRVDELLPKPPTGSVYTGQRCELVICTGIEKCGDGWRENQTATRAIVKNAIETPDNTTFLSFRPDLSFDASPLEPTVENAIMVLERLATKEQ
jgi:hypothetical protein